RGGDGVVRELLFRRPLTLSILTERRVFAPFGLEEGESGMKGENLLIRKNGRIIRLASKTSVDVEKGDVFRLQTPGGGGFGPPEEGSKKEEPPSKRQKTFIQRGSVHEYTKSQEGV
ncbi:unnamed protein product, partial [Meganyctiphanes norvegica]